MLKISDNLYTLYGMIVGRVYLIQDPDGLTLIDTSIPPRANAILKQIESAGFKPTDVKRILITHAHPDHIGSLHKVQAATGAEVWAGQAEADVIESKSPIATPPREKVGGILKFLIPTGTMSKPSTPVGRILKEGDVLTEVLGGLVALHTPGHAIDHFSFWHPERRILIVGDVIFNMIGLTLPLPFVTVDMEQDKRSAARLIALNPDLVCFGHGAPLRGQDATEKLAAFALRVHL